MAFWGKMNGNVVVLEAVFVHLYSIVKVVPDESNGVIHLWSLTLCVSASLREFVPSSLVVRLTRSIGYAMDKRIGRAVSPTTHHCPLSTQKSD
jgi:hypothetical protein